MVRRGNGRSIAARAIRLVLGTVLALGVTYVILGWLTHRLIYFPTRGQDRTPADVGLEFEDLTLTTEDGVSVAAWFVEHPEAERTVIWFHGNAGNLSGRVGRIARLVEQRVSVLALDYRGYGRSEGRPDEEGTFADARAAWDFVAARGVAPEDVVLLGSSLGAAVALRTAVDQPSCGRVVLEAPFTSVRDLAPFWIPSFFVPNLYDNVSKIQLLRMPVVIYHGTSDPVIPIEHSMRLQSEAGGPCTVIAVRGADHAPLDALSPADVMAHAGRVARGEAVDGTGFAEEDVRTK